MGDSTLNHKIDLKKKRKEKKVANTIGPGKNQLPLNRPAACLTLLAYHVLRWNMPTKDLGPWLHAAMSQTVTHKLVSSSSQNCSIPNMPSFYFPLARTDQKSWGPL